MSLDDRPEVAFGELCTDSPRRRKLPASVATWAAPDEELHSFVNDLERGPRPEPRRKGSWKNEGATERKSFRLQRAEGGRLAN